MTIKPFQPSNATVGASFIDGWCARCKRDRVMNGSVDIDAASDSDLCPILGATMAFSPPSQQYPSEWRYDDEGDPVCTAFETVDAPNGSSCAVRDDATPDMFGGSA